MKRETIKYLLLATRPKTLPASLSPIIVGLSYSHYMGITFSLLTAILTGVVALLLQISTNLVNDYYDSKSGIDQKREFGPTRVTQKGLLKPEHVKLAFLTTFSLALILVFPLFLRGGVPMIILTSSCFLAAFLYTGGPLPLSHFALGEVLAFLFFGPIAAWGVYYLQSLQLDIQSASTLLLVGTPTGLISAQIMSINNLRDRNSDATASKITISTLLPEKFARAVTITLLLLSILTPFLILPNLLPITFLILLSPLPFIMRWKCLWAEQISNKFNDALAATGQYMFLHALLLATIFILSR